MRILQIANYKPGSGGISVQVDKIQSCLDAEGVDNSIFSTKGSLRYRVKAFFKLFRIGCEYDVFHIHTCSQFGFLTAVMGITVGRKMKKRIVLTYHGGDAEAFFYKHMRLVKHFLMKTDANIALSGFIGGVFDDFDIPHVEIPNIIELDASRFKERKVINPNFISIRTLSPLYNIECILDAFGMVKKQIPEATLTIVGDGPSREKLENKVADMELRDVSFIGRVDNSEIYHYLNQADIMVSSPVIDNMPVSVLEGMNAGLLVISSNVGGIPYMIDDGVNGLLFNAKNPESLAEKMILAVKNQDRTLSMIRMANQSLGKYTWESVKQKLLPLYGA